MTDQVSIGSALELADDTREQIAKVLGVEQSVVEQAITEALQSDLAAINAIKKAVYLAALGGDEAAMKLSVPLFAMINELNRQKLMEVPQLDKSGEQTPYGAVRDAVTVMAMATPVAVATLIQVARHGRTDSVRIAASNSLLDRTGLGRSDRTEIAVITPETDMNGRESMIEVLKKRMEKLRPSPEIIDALPD